MMLDRRREACRGRSGSSDERDGKHRRHTTAELRALLAKRKKAVLAVRQMRSCLYEARPCGFRTSERLNGLPAPGAEAPAHENEHKVVDLLLRRVQRPKHLSVGDAQRPRYLTATDPITLDEPVNGAFARVQLAQTVVDLTPVRCDRRLLLDIGSAIVSDHRVEEREPEFRADVPPSSSRARESPAPSTARVVGAPLNRTAASRGQTTRPGTGPRAQWGPRGSTVGSDPSRRGRGVAIGRASGRCRPASCTAPARRLMIEPQRTARRS